MNSIRQILTKYLITNELNFQKQIKPCRRSINTIVNVHFCSNFIHGTELKNY